MRAPSCARRWVRNPFRDEAGLTTTSMVIALLLTLALVFSTAQVYRVNSFASNVQSVADAAALAAENEVAEFMIAVRVCDAVVLTLTLTGLVATGLGIVALCTPMTAPASEGLLAAGERVTEGRDAFARKAAEGLSALQRALPFVAAANAASIAQAADDGSAYMALAVLVPSKAADIEVGVSAGLAEAQDAVASEADEVRRRAAEAEEAAQRANEAKLRGFAHDCGSAPAYCLYERAATLAGMTGADNPLFRSVDTWSFSVALDRAKAYYPRRLAEERPAGSSVEEQARSALRTVFYAFAAREVGQGYVHEGEGTFEAFFPRLPKNTDEMRATALYTDAAYPLTVDDAGRSVLHAWAGCPRAAGASGKGSLKQMEEGAYPVCETCGFSASSLGAVAAASSSIDNGFEYHYAAVAEAAESYEAARAAAEPLDREVKERVGGLLDGVREALDAVKSMRIDARPPGSDGVVVLAATSQDVMPSSGFESAFVQAAGVLGTRAAVSAATLAADPAGEGATVVSSLLDGLQGEGGVVGDAASTVLDGWSSLLGAYADGQAALQDAVEDGIAGLPLSGASGLGPWAAGALRDVAEAAGIEPAELDALKPLLVNSAHVAQADDGAFCARLLSLKEQAIAHPLDSNDAFSSAVGAVEQGLLADVDALGEKVEIASIELFGDDGPSIPIEIALPPSVTSGAKELIEWAANGLRGVYGSVTGVRVWE